MNTNLEGFNVKEITLYTEQDIQPGMAVMIAEGYKAVLPVANTRFIGVCTSRNGDYVSVAVSGVMTTRCESDSLYVGYNSLSGDGKGGLKPDGGAMVETLVIDFDTENDLVKILL